MPDHAQKPIDIALVVDSDDEKRLTELQNMLLSDPVVKDLGLPVSKAAAAKKAFRRGLEVLLQEGVRGEGSDGWIADLDRRVADLERRLDDIAGRPIERGAATKTEGAVKRPEGPDIQYDGRGRIVRPGAWEVWSANEAFPASQADVHEYYERHGWQRVWGQSGAERLVFYWCNDPDEQRLEPWPRSGPGGGGVVVQETPWGPCHLIARNWDESVAGQPQAKPEMAASGKATVMS